VDIGLVYFWSGLGLHFLDDIKNAQLGVAWWDLHFVILNALSVRFDA